MPFIVGMNDKTAASDESRGTLSQVFHSLVNALLGRYRPGGDAAKRASSMGGEEIMEAPPLDIAHAFCLFSYWEDSQ